MINGIVWDLPKKVRVQMELDKLMYGEGFVEARERRWLNPVRWFRGKHYYRNLPYHSVEKCYCVNR